MLTEFDRYTTSRMTKLWSLDRKYAQWVEVEIAAAEAQDAPSEALEEMRQAPVPQAAAVDREEIKTRHDVIAFLNVWRAGMGPAGRSWTHRGLTSSDVVDTANGMRLKESTDAIRDNLKLLQVAVGKQAIQYRHALRVGRTHGQHAEVTTWGWRMAVFFYDLQRADLRLGLLSQLFEVGKLSGPVGDYKTIDPSRELTALVGLGLRPAGATTQVVSRDVYVDYVYALSQVANVIDNMATEIRLSARTEVAEVREGFGPAQRGSSAMPHKRNPIMSEKLSGLARLVRAQVDPVAQGVALHHERDISHSSVDRLALTMASQLTDHMIDVAKSLVTNLVVYPNKMLANAVQNDDLLSSLIKNALVERHGFDPERAYDVVFFGFSAWNRPDRDDSGPATLADALADSWYELAEKEHLDAHVPGLDFEDLVALGDDPGQLIGNNWAVYDEIGFHLSGLQPDLPF